MKFLYQYRTSQNEKKDGVIWAASREAAYSVLKAQGIRPERLADAPGFFNKLFGRGKRWLAIGVLCAVCVVLALALGRARTPAAPSFGAGLDSTVRRQPIGDAAIIEKGIRTGWADVFELEGDRFLASFAIPGATPAIRSTTVEKVLKALSTKHWPSEATQPKAYALSTRSDGLEARQVRAMVEGLKEEIREFLSDGGTIEEYGRLLVKRQDQERAYYNQAKTEIDTAAASGMPQEELLDVWERANGKLRGLGVKLVPLPE